MMTKFFCSLFTLLFTISAFATHNRAGEIIFSRVDDLQIEATVITYTKTSSIPADRDSLEICWGDGTCLWILRNNGPDNDGNGIPDGIELSNNVKKNEYTDIHTYDQYGDYKLSMEDPNRNSGILNVDFPNSDNVAFFLKHEFSLTAAIDNSPVLLEAPIDNGFIGEPFYHTPNAFDIDGDSLAYHLVAPYGSGGIPVANYLPVTEFPAGGSTVSMDEETGLFKWSTPQLVGEYVITYEVTSFRDGVLIGSMIRDMQITISDLVNLLPDLVMTEFVANDYTSVQVDDTIQFLIFGEDLDNENELSMTVTSGLYDESFSQTPVFNVFFQNAAVTEAVFSWHIKAEHVRDQPYQVVFKLADDLGLANYVVLRFKVVDMLTNSPSTPELEQYKIYPNPCVDFLQVEIENLSDNYFEILNGVGQIVKSGNLSGNKQIDVRELSQGVYFLMMDETRKQFVKL